MGKLSKTWTLLKVSWEVLKKDKEMVIFPLAGTVFWFLFIVGLTVPFAVWSPEGAINEDTPGFYVYLFLFLFTTYFLMTVANAALIACAIKRMAGGDPTVGDGFRAAFSRLHVIMGWSLLSATLGVLLKVLEKRFKGVGSLIADIIGGTWGVVSYLVVPVMVMENKGPIEALKRSAVLLKQTWGEQFIGDFSFALAYLASLIPAIIILVPAFIFGDPRISIILLSTAAAVVLGLWLVLSVLQSIFQSALYRYAFDRNPGEGFGGELLGNCFIPPKGPE